MAITPPWENDRYTTPKSDATVEKDIEQLRKTLTIAKRQKSLLCALLLLILSAISLPIFLGDITPNAQLVLLPLQIAILILMARLCFKLYGAAAALLLTILTVIPVIGLLALLVANAKANNVIKSKGFSVGILGANTKAIANSL